MIGAGVGVLHWEGVGRVLGGRWEGVGRVLGGCWEGVGRAFAGGEGCVWESDLKVNQIATL